MDKNLEKSTNNLYDKLQKILSIISEKHLDMYFNITKEDLEEYIKEILKSHELKDNYDLYYIINVIIKRIFGKIDSHTKLIWKENDFNLPIRLKVINHKVYVIKASKDNEDLIYGEVLKINNVAISKIIEEIENMTTYSTEQYLFMQIEDVLHNGKKLKSLPSISNNANSFVFKVLKDDKIITRQLAKTDIKLSAKNNYTYRIINDVMYLDYSSCQEDYPGQMLEFVNTISEEAKKNNITNFIVDIRNNSGGNSEIIKPLIEFLKDKKVITLTGRYVFSSGRFALCDLVNIGSITLGTEIATSLNCFGDVITCEIDDFILQVSGKYFYYDNEKKKILLIKEKDKFLAFKNNPNNSIYFEPQFFEPNYYVENTLNDYQNHNDRQVYSALLLIRTRMKNDCKEEKIKIKTPQDLMEFLDNNIVYGWLDKNKKRYINTLSNFKENYQVSTIEETLISGVGTCIEDAMLIKYCLEKIGFATKMYCYRAYEDDDNFDSEVKMHCFVLFKKDDCWYHFEYSDNKMKGITKYNYLEDAILNVINIEGKDGQVLTEIDDIPMHISFKELNQYVNSFPIVEIKDKKKEDK